MQLRNEWTFVIDIVRLDNFEYCCDKHEIRKVMFWHRVWMKNRLSFKQFSDSYTCTYQTLFIRWCYNIGITQMLGHWRTIKCNTYCLHLLIVLDLTRFASAALFARGLIPCALWLNNQRHYLCCGFMGIHHQRVMFKQEQTSYFSNQTNRNEKMS